MCFFASELRLLLVTLKLDVISSEAFRDPCTVSNKSCMRKTTQELKKKKRSQIQHFFIQSYVKRIEYEFLAIFVLLFSYVLFNFVLPDLKVEEELAWIKTIAQELLLQKDCVQYPQNIQYMNGLSYTKLWMTLDLFMV